MPKPSLAIAYHAKKKACHGGKMYAAGGQITDNYQSDCTDMCNTPCEIHPEASGFVEHEGNDVKRNGPASSESARGLGQHGEDEQGPYSTKMALGGGVQRTEGYEAYKKKDTDVSGGYAGASDKRYDLVYKAQMKRMEEQRKQRMAEHPEEYAEGGDLEEDSGAECETEPSGERVCRIRYSKADLDEGGEMSSGRDAPAEQRKIWAREEMAHGGFIGSHQTKEHEMDMVGRILKQRQNHYSEGGKVANNAHEFEYEFETPNQFDDLVLRDDLESTYGDDDNSGDALGNKGEDERRKDIVSKIMKSRRLKDRNPRPA